MQDTNIEALSDTAKAAFLAKTAALLVLIEAREQLHSTDFIVRFFKQGHAERDEAQRAFDVASKAYEDAKAEHTAAWEAIKQFLAD